MLRECGLKLSCAYQIGSAGFPMRKDMLKAANFGFKDSSSRCKVYLNEVFVCYLLFLLQAQSPFRLAMAW